MNKNEKLAELETRQRELADEIRTLRDTPDTKLQLREGGVYRRRDGMLTNPLLYNDDSVLNKIYPWSDGTATWTPTGKWYSDGQQSIRDLIEEVPAPRREPQPGDVWLDPDVEDGLLLIIEDGVDVGVWLDNYAMTGFSLEYIADNLTYLGRFTDLYRRQ